MQLHNAAIEVQFNPLNFRQVDEAKKKYLQARRENRKILDLDGSVIERFQPNAGGFRIAETELIGEEFAFHILDATGDKRVIWNARDPHQIREAKEQFDKYVAKGWKPYAIDRHGNMGKRIREFDAEAQEIVFDDKGGGIREKLKDFGKKFREVKMMPRTYPG